MAWLTALVVSGALAQGFDAHKPHVPSAGVATENGPGALWVNPANLAFDPDRRYGLFFGRGEGDTPTSIALTAGIEGLGVGLHNLVRPDGQSDWSLDYGTSIALPERVAIGLMFSWNFRQDTANYVAYDAGMAWRPLPWFGLGAAAQNIGTPDTSGISQARTTFGLALRPLGPGVVLGADYVRRFPTMGTSDSLRGRDEARALARFRPTEGLYVRTHVDLRAPTERTSPASGWRLSSVGAALEVYFGGIGGGFHQQSLATADMLQTAWLGTDEPGESLFRSGRRVPALGILEKPSYEPTTFLFSLDPGPSWLDLLELLRRTEDQPGVRGLVLTLGSTNLSWAQHQELRDRIRGLEERGRPVVVYLTGQPDTAAYHTAAAASRIVLHPASTLDLIGTRAELMHLRGVMDLVGIEPQFVRRAEYKAAPESLSLHEPSVPALEQENALLDDRWHHLLRSIEAGRGVDTELATEWVDGGPHSPTDALKLGIVDAVAYADDLEAVLQDLHGVRVVLEDLRRAPQARSPWEDPAQIALVYVDGVIVPGESSRGGLLGPKTAGSATIVSALSRAREDALVRAVVIRVDSPGGSAFASDEIWHAVERLKASGKPVVVSFGGVAASGGYYVATGADSIWAQPTTITGSIGVFNSKLATQDLRERIGVTTTILTRGTNSDISSTARPWDAAQRDKMQELVDHTYRQFSARVSEGRSLDAAAVEEAARGRVWSGASALESGLVDQIGGLQDAILDARERAGISPSRKVGLVSYGRGGNLLETLAPSLITQAVAKAAAGRQPAPTELGTLLAPIEPALLLLSHPDVHVWALDPRFLDEVSR